ncbi:MAG: ribosome maturation factor RimM [Azoarcus sp.]|jgi:16S rRNA processing protein RimM|nr:ribosome maturation factor RimM [Azoarcus sp.]
MIVLGRIAAPFGVKGWFRVKAFGDDPLSWREMPHWWIAAADDLPVAQWSRRALLACQAHHKGLIASLEGIADRTAAEAVGGWYIAAPRQALPSPEEGEYYWGDLVGMAVLDEAGTPLGEVIGLLSTGAHDVLQVRNGEAERLIPFVAAHVTRVDPGARTIYTLWHKDW